MGIGPGDGKYRKNTNKVSVRNCMYRILEIDAQDVYFGSSRLTRSSAITKLNLLINEEFECYELPGSQV